MENIAELVALDLMSDAILGPTFCEDRISCLLEASTLDSPWFNLSSTSLSAASEVSSI
ncbi:hypothetical protein D3C85_1539880 [compost metagenome]